MTRYEKGRRPVNRKAKGTRLERKTRKIFEGLGFMVTRSGASFGPWDLIAVPRGTWGVSSHRLLKSVWRWDDYKRQPRVKEFHHGWQELPIDGDVREYIELDAVHLIQVKANRWEGSAERSVLEVN